MNPDVKAAYSAALRLLTQREYCEVELRRKLQGRGIDDIAIDSALEELKGYGYLNELRFAESFLRSRLQRGEALWLAAQKASQKGVDAQALQLARESLSEEFDAWAMSRELIVLRDPQGLRHQDRRVWQRLARFLQNKGFDTDTILRTLNATDDE